MSDQPDTHRRSNASWAPLAVVPVLLVAVLGGYWGFSRYSAGRAQSETLAQLPERPPLDASTQTLAPVLDKAITAVEESPTAERVGQLGKIYQANYFYDEAAACYERAMALAPDDALWPYLLSYVESMKGAARGTELLDRAIALDPNYVPALLRRADGRYKDGDHEGAKADYERCLELHIGNPYAHLGLGRIAIDDEAWEAAEKHLLRAADGDGPYGAAFTLLATVYAKLDKPEERARAMARADTEGRFVASPDPRVDDLEALCQHTEQLLTKADRAGKLERYDDAERYFRRVLALEPDNFLANGELGNLLQRQHRFQEAASLLERAVTAPSRGELLRLKDLHYNLGNNYYWQDKPAQAVPHYEKALELAPDVIAAYHGLAGCYLKLGEPQKVIEQCKAALEIVPESPEAHFNWGQALLMLDDVEGALPHYAEAKRLEPQMPSPDFRAGMYYFGKGDRERAEPYLRRALEGARAEGNGEVAGRLEAMLSQ